MYSGIAFSVTTSDRLRLEALVEGRNTLQKHVWRTRVVLLSADGFGTPAIMREAGVSKTAIWRWQERYAQEGIDGLLRDKTRPVRIPPLGPEVAARVVTLTQADPPGEITHRTAAALAKVAAISVSLVQRIRRGQGLPSRRVRQFTLSTDPAFAATLRDVVRLYVDPPAHAVVLSVDQNSQIRTPARIQHPPPMKPAQPTSRPAGLINSKPPFHVRQEAKGLRCSGGWRPQSAMTAMSEKELASTKVPATMNAIEIIGKPQAPKGNSTLSTCTVTLGCAWLSSCGGQLGFTARSDYGLAGERRLSHQRGWSEARPAHKMTRAG